MVSRAAACALAVAAALAVAPTPGRAAPSAPPAAATPFEGRVAAAKTAMMGDPQAALKISTAALDLARGEPSTRQAMAVATAQWLQGEALLRLGRLDEATRVLDQALAVVAVRAPDTKLHADLVMAQAIVRAERGQVQLALSGYQAAYRIFGAAHEPRSQAKALMYIGSIYQDARDYAKVLQYYAQAAELYPADTVLLVTADNNIGNALRAQKKFPEAVAAFAKARGVARQMESPGLEAEILTNQAAAEVEWGRLDAAQAHVDEARKLIQGEAGAEGEMFAIWGVAAQIQLKRNQPRLAAQYLARAFEGVDLDESPLPFRDFHETAWSTYEKLGDEHQALAHLRAFKRLDDQARELAASTNAALMSAQFDYANQVSRIAKLKAGQLQARNMITTGLLAGSLLIGALLLVSFLSIRRSRNQVRAANGLLSETNGLLEKALRARTEFLANTSHEIRTPLNGILGMTSVILGMPALDRDLREKIGVVNAGAETMRALVDDILDIARIETDGVTLSRTGFDLPKLCHETVELWRDKAAEKGLDLTVDLSEAPAHIVEDAGRLRQILFNLMSNAIKFTEAGHVRLTVALEVAEFGEQIVFRLEDTGVGIPHDKLEEVFESFRQLDSSTTRNHEGVGLGLAISQRVARAMEGDIYIDSAVGRGATVTVRLPLKRGLAEDAPTAAEAGAAPQGLADCRLLILDANPLTQSVIKAVLTPQVRSVEAAFTTEGIEPGRHDLVLVDAAALGAERPVQLAMLGLLVATAHPAPVCLTIGDLEGGGEVALLGAGAARVIRKPIAAPALVAELQAALSARDHVASPSEASAA